MTTVARSPSRSSPNRSTQSTKTRSFHNVDNEEEDTINNSVSESTAIETQKCDSPCNELFNYSEMRVFSCGHVVYPKCRADLKQKESVRTSDKHSAQNPDPTPNPNSQLCMLGGKCSTHAF